MLFSAILALEKSVKWATLPPTIINLAYVLAGILESYKYETTLELNKNKKLEFTIVHNKKTLTIEFEDHNWINYKQGKNKGVFLFSRYYILPLLDELDK